jgi:ankyrin repeat protein
VETRSRARHSRVILLGYILLNGSKGREVNFVFVVAYRRGVVMEGFRAAILAADVKQVQTLIHANKNVNCHDNMDTSPLFLAVRNGKIECARTLLEAKASVEGESILGWPLAHVAAFAVRPLMMELVLSAKAQMNPDSKVPCLHMSVINDGVECAKVLLRAKAPINQRNHRRELAVHIAAKRAPRMLRFLIKAKGAINAHDRRGNTPLHIAACGNEEACTTLLRAKAELDSTNTVGKSPLHLAAMDDDDLECLRVLLCAKANVNAVDNNYRSPLHFAAVDNIRGMKLLLQAKCALWNRELNGLTCLDITQQNNHHAGVPLLLEAKAGLDDHDQGDHHDHNPRKRSCLGN